MSSRCCLHRDIGRTGAGRSLALPCAVIALVSACVDPGSPARDATSEAPDVPAVSDVQDAGQTDRDGGAGRDQRQDTATGASDLGQVDTEVSPCVDRDHDGYYTCVDENFPEWPTEIDCDDTLWHVQPGGYEFPDNDIDDNCNDEIDELSPCDCPLEGSVAPLDLLASMDLCDDTVGTALSSGETYQFSATADYHGIQARRGSCLTVISTGDVASENVQDYSGMYDCWPGDGTSSFPDPDPRSTGDWVCDLAQLQVTLHPPRNARGLQFRLMFLTAEWPEFLCQMFNDTFYAIYTSELLFGGQPTNISFDIRQREITVNVGFFENPAEWTEPLDQTPFGEADPGASCYDDPYDPAEECTLPPYCGSGANLGYVGSGTGWLLTRAPFERGEEEVTLVFSIHDEGDSLLDSVVLLDDFQWLPYKPPVTTSK